MNKMYVAFLSSVAFCVLSVMTIGGAVSSNSSRRSQQQALNESYRRYAISKLRLVDDAVQEYRVRHGAYPEALEVGWLRELISKEIGTDTLCDAWDTPFKYDRKGPKNQGRKPDIWTLPPNEFGGGVIANWLLDSDKNKKKEGSS